MLILHPFIIRVFSTAENLNNEMIVVGDFNLVIDPVKDYFNYLHENKHKSQRSSFRPNEYM